tara:strand:+ start:140 stop:472 length:333 start_codon:yes stop_codon:yes gene_type:complete
MFNFAKAKQQARSHLHSILAVPAVYTRMSDSKEFPLTARLHRKIETIGGDEGFGQMIAEEDRVVFLAVDLEAIGPVTGDTVFFADEKVTAMIETVEPAQLPSQTCNVSLE